jgi:hypothetical protein
MKCVRFSAFVARALRANRLLAWHCIQEGAGSCSRISRKPGACRQALGRAPHKHATKRAVHPTLTTVLPSPIASVSSSVVGMADVCQ